MSQERARFDVLHPTLCDETAKDGAPEHWWAGGENDHFTNRTGGENNHFTNRTGGENDHFTNQGVAR